MLESIITEDITIAQYLICAGTALLFGLILALLYSLGRPTENSGFALTVVLMPLIVQNVILLVNGSLGIGVAVAGTFSLIRFRSLPLSARQIILLFAAMAVGLACGTGCIGIAGILTLIFAAGYLLITMTRFGLAAASALELKITLPENVDYSTLFDDAFSRYTKTHRLIRIKTTDMGSLFDLTYQVVLRDDTASKQFIDELRSLNSNLAIQLRQLPQTMED